jgi:hypothetical protein
LKSASNGTGSLSARIYLSEKLRLQKCYVFEGRLVQKSAGPRMDLLFFSLVDYPCGVETISLHEHESRRRGILDRKDCSDVPPPLHG